ncbi:DUF4365 domain-containing protein [Dactylosporangium sp. CS-047395]|uniref:DUF4365 domain-containing protein n=1 Tax=Dactylosporangium sp. CS-047395 TaxID=3239936 RepID=UPI003D8BBBF0
MRGAVGDETGEQGIDAVSLDFRRIHWAPVVNSRGDLGTDLFVQVRDERRFSLGLVVGVQVKAGPSWFDDPALDAGGAVIGWWFYEPDKRHFDEWVEHGLPHLVVLHDLDKQVSYWSHVTAAAVQSTGKGSKILVPITQTIDAEHAHALIEVAATMRVGVALQGTAWAADGVPIGPGSLLRHAMIASRLVAPHPNATVKELTPEQALALIVQGRHFDLNRYVNSKAAPTMEDAARPKSAWRWRLVAAMWQYTTTGDDSELTPLTSLATSAPDRAAGAIVAACTAMDGERFEDAIQLLSEVVEDAEPIDCAWLLAQRARVLSELGHIAQARQDAARAQRSVMHASEDLTAAAIGAAAAQLLFQTSAWSERTVGSVIEASDTAVSWWRGQQMANGLMKAAERHFRRYADDTAVVIGGTDVAQNSLFGVQLGAHLTGEHGTWRSAASLLGQHELMVWQPDQGFERHAAALDDLRRAGDRDQLKLAVVRTWRVGPVAALADAVRRVQNAPWTHTTTGTNLVMWRHGGDLLPPAMATIAADRCIEVLADPASPARIAAPFRVDAYVLQALAGVLPAADDRVHREVAAMLATQPADVGPGEVQDEIACLKALRHEVLTDADVAGLRERSRRLRESHLSADFIGALAVFDEDSRRVLLERIAAGDLGALAALEGDDLPVDAAAQAVRLAAEHTVGIVEQARRHEYRDRSWDPVADLAHWNCRFPEIADWAALVSVLAESAVPGEYKRFAFVRLAADIERVPEDVRAELRSVVSSFAEPPNPFGITLGRPAGGTITYLAMALGTLDVSQYAEAASRLMAGTSQDRQDFIRFVAGGDPLRWAPALLALLGDGDVQVRAVAAHRVAIAALDHDDELLRAAVLRAAADPGALVPMASAAGLCRGSDPHPDLVEAMQRFLSHPSYKVRSAALAALDGWAETATT